MTLHSAKLAVLVRMAWVGSLLLLNKGALASPYELAYSGRLVDESGKPITKSLNLRIRFYNAATGGASLGSEIRLRAVQPNLAGLFTLALSLPSNEMNTILGGSDVWIEITDTETNTSYPRQQLRAVPYALKVPHDGQSLTYDSSGQLSVNYVSSSKITGLSSLLNEKAPSIHDHTLSGDVQGSVTASTVSKLQGRAVASQAPSNGQFLRWNGSAWTPSDIGSVSLGSQSFLGLGVYSNNQETTLSLSAADRGRMWYNTDSNQVRYYDGTSIQSVGGSVSGVLSINGLTSDNQTLSINSNGTQPNIQSSGSTHTLSIPLASAPGVTAGLISKSDFDSFNSKMDQTNGFTTLFTQNQLRFQEASPSGQNYVALRAPSSIASDVVWTLPAADGALGQILMTNGSGALSWTSINPGTVTNIIAAAPLSVTNGTTTPSLTLSQADASTSGYLSSADWNTFSAKEPALSAGTSAQFYRGDKSWQTLNSDAVVEGTRRYFTEARARQSISATGLLNYDSATGIINMSEVGSAQITDLSIVNADISESAAINSSKINFLTDGISGDAIDGGTISNFKSTGISDQATALSVTITSSGNMGLGTTTPLAKLDVAGGAIYSRSVAAASSTAIDWSLGNVQAITPTVSTLAFTNLQDGGAYTLAVTDSSGFQYNFTQSGLTFTFVPVNAQVAVGSKTLYSFLRVGSVVYVTWTSGF